MSCWTRRARCARTGGRSSSAWPRAMARVPGGAASSSRAVSSSRTASPTTCTRIRRAPTARGGWTRCRSCSPPSEWREIETGVAQRAELLDALLADLYGPQRLLAEGVVPPELPFGHPNFLWPCHGIAPRGGTWVHIYAADLARAPDGRLVGAVGSHAGALGCRLCARESRDRGAGAARFDSRSERSPRARVLRGLARAHARARWRRARSRSR